MSFVSSVLMYALATEIITPTALATPWMVIAFISLFCLATPPLKLLFLLEFS
jgi:hypothetical protein